MFHISGGRLYWYAYLNAPEGVEDPPGERKSEVRRHFGGWNDVIDETIEGTDEAHNLRNDVHDRRPSRKWGEGRVTMLGDAAHPTTANLGQGACQALESAVWLASILRDHRSEPEEAMRRYEAARFARAALITHASWSIAVPGQWSNPWVCAVRNRLGYSLPKSLKALIFEKAFLTTELPTL